MDGGCSWIWASSAPLAEASSKRGQQPGVLGISVIRTALEESPATGPVFLFSFSHFQRPKIRKGRREKSLFEIEQEFF